MIFSTNSFSIASAFLRMIGWPNSPIFPKIFTLVSTVNSVWLAVISVKFVMGLPLTAPRPCGLSLRAERGAPIGLVLFF